MKVKYLAIKAACLLGKCITGIIILGLLLTAYFGILGCIAVGGAWLFSVLPGLIYAIVYIVGIIVLGLILMLTYFIGEDIFNKYNIKLCRKR